MSGHSKWSKIKRAKGAKDAKKGALFTKLAKNISLAAKEGGADPDMNFTLRLAIDKAKVANMPSDNIDRAVAKGAGGDNGDEISRVSYEAYGPDGVGIIIDCQTDNTNRTVAEVRKLVEDSGGKIASQGSVSWKFAEKGLISVVPAKLVKAEKYGAEDTYEAIDKEEAQLELLEVEGVEDMSEISDEDEDGNTIELLELITDKVDFAKVLKDVEQKKFKIHSAELIKTASETISVDDKSREKIENIVSNLEDHDDVDSVWTDMDS